MSEFQTHDEEYPVRARLLESVEEACPLKMMPPRGLARQLALPWHEGAESENSGRPIHGTSGRRPEICQWFRSRISRLQDCSPPPQYVPTARVWASGKRQE